MKDFNRIILLMVSYFFPLAALLSQNSGDKLELNSLRNFGPRNGTLDTISTNPSISKVNNKPLSIKYKRDEYSRYDNIKIYPDRKLVDVSTYATHDGNPPKISMKVYTSAPAGTMIEIQLGSKQNDNYPQGVHSQFQAQTKVRNEWELLEFTYATTPEGSEVDAQTIDKITIVFSPNSDNNDVYYFNDLKGPPLLSD